MPRRKKRSSQHAAILRHKHIQFLLYGPDRLFRLMNEIRARKAARDVENICTRSGHAWKGFDRVHNKNDGKGKYQWYKCVRYEFKQKRYVRKKCHSKSVRCEFKQKRYVRKKYHSKT